MNEQTKRKMIRAYFKKPSGCAIALLVIGVILALIGFAGAGGGQVFMGLLMLIVGALLIYSSVGGKPSDQQMDAWLEEDLKILSDKSLNKMGTDKDELTADSVYVTGPRLWDTAGAPVRFRQGKDNILRFTPVGVSVIHFTENQLLSYSCALDRTTGNALNESTDEYFYRDVVSVATKTESKTVNIPGIKGPVQMQAAETFTLTTSGGTSLSVLLRDPTLVNKMGGGEIPTTRAEKAIQSVRTMLRGKKGTPQA
jgi:hypothetical protein